MKFNFDEEEEVFPCRICEENPVPLGEEICAKCQQTDADFDAENGGLEEF